MKHPVFSFSALLIPFFIDFSHFSDQAAYFLLFIALFDFAVTFLLFYSFNVFSLLDMLHSLSIFLAYLSLFFCVQFYVFPNSQRFLFFFSAFFTSYCHSSAPSPLSLLLSPVFLLFRPSLTAFASFQPFFSFSQLIFIFFLFFVYSAVSCPLFAIFQFFLHFFVSTYVTLPGSFFHVSHPSKCFT